MITLVEILAGKRSQVLIDGEVVGLVDSTPGANVGMLTHDVADSELGDIARFLDAVDQGPFPERMFLFPGVRKRKLRARAVKSKAVNTYAGSDA
jgi:hypothetical protein